MFGSRSDETPDGDVVRTPEGNEYPAAPATGRFVVAPTEFVGSHYPPALLGQGCRSSSAATARC